MTTNHRNRDRSVSEPDEIDYASRLRDFWNEMRKAGRVNVNAKGVHRTVDDLVSASLKVMLKQIKDFNHGKPGHLKHTTNKKALRRMIRESLEAQGIAKDAKGTASAPLKEESLK